jgi:hypothetical protein
MKPTGSFDIAGVNVATTVVQIRISICERKKAEHLLV